MKRFFNIFTIIMVVCCIFGIISSGFLHQASGVIWGIAALTLVLAWRQASLTADDNYQQILRLEDSVNEMKNARDEYMKEADRYKALYEKLAKEHLELNVKPVETELVSPAKTTRKKKSKDDIKAEVQDIKDKLNK